MEGPNVRTTAALIAVMAAGVGCQTEQALQPRPAERGGPPPARTMLAADADLVQRVRAELAREPLLAQARIRVEPLGSGLRLSGMVRTRAEQQRAVDIASETVGARRVGDALIRRGESGVAAGPLADARIQL